MVTVDEYNRELILQLYFVSLDEAKLQDAMRILIQANPPKVPDNTGAVAYRGVPLPAKLLDLRRIP